jgi:hypothetical protein
MIPFNATVYMKFHVIEKYDIAIVARMVQDKHTHIQQLVHGSQSAAQMRTRYKISPKRKVCNNNKRKSICCTVRQKLQKRLNTAEMRQTEKFLRGTGDYIPTIFYNYSHCFQSTAVPQCSVC